MNYNNRYYFKISNTKKSKKVKINVCNFTKGMSLYCRVIFMIYNIRKICIEN